MSLEEVRERVLSLLRLDIAQFRPATQANEQNRAGWCQAMRYLAGCGVLHADDVRALVDESVAAWTQSWQGECRGQYWTSWRVVNTVLLLFSAIILFPMVGTILAAVLGGHRTVP